MSLLVVGSVAYDNIKTPHGEAADTLGGSAVYFSLASSLFGPARLVGVVGGDFRDDHVELLKSKSIDTSGLEVVEDGKTFRWTGEYMPNMNDRETLEVDLNVFEDFQPKIPAEFRDSKYVFLANGAPVTQLSVLDQVEHPALVVADTMDLWITTQREDLTRLLALIDGLVINDSEAHLLTGEHNMVTAGRKILELGPSFVVLKKGEHGCMLFSGDSVAPLPGVSDGTSDRPDGRWRQFRGSDDGLSRERGTPR